MKMTNFYKVILVLLLQISATVSYADSKCVFSGELVEDLKLFRDVLRNTSRMSLVQKIPDTEEYLKQYFNHEFVDLNGFDLILLGKNAEQHHDLYRNFFFGADIRNKELDFIIFHPVQGVDSNNIISFKFHFENKQCELRTKVIEERYYTAIKLVASNVLTLGVYSAENGERLEYSSFYTFH